MGNNHGISSIRTCEKLQLLVSKSTISLYMMAHTVIRVFLMARLDFHLKNITRHHHSNFSASSQPNSSAYDFMVVIAAASYKGLIVGHPITSEVVMRLHFLHADKENKLLDITGCNATPLSHLRLWGYDGDDCKYYSVVIRYPVERAAEHICRMLLSLPLLDYRLGSFLRKLFMNLSIRI